MKKVSVVILNWNGRKLLETYLHSVIKYSDIKNCEIVVADNASNDDSIEYIRENFPQVKVLTFDRNYGFAEGYNKAIKQINAEYVVLLNSDIEVSHDWLSILINYLDENPEVVAVQPKILSWRDKSKFEYAGAAGGFIDVLGYPFCRGRILDTVEMDNGQYDSIIPVFWATGACLCIRKKAYMEAGGLDRDFFAHMEEIDLCWRLNSKGGKIMCVPQSVVYHLGGASLSTENPYKTYLNFRNNWLMLYKNVEFVKLLWILPVRYLLDIAAALHLAVSGKFKNAINVFKAHKDFILMVKKFRSRKKECLLNKKVTEIPTKFNFSIIMQYYAMKNKTYKSLFK